MAARSLLAIAAATLACGLVLIPATAALAEAKGKTCHMEQQCHWENFKKICVWVKVCR
jgi:hypothetical protein